MSYVEITVLVAIVVVLVLLAIPETGRGVKADQAYESSNIRQLGILLYADAVDHGGNYRSNATFSDTIAELIRDNVLNDFKILGGKAAKHPTNSVWSSSNIAWSYFPGLKTSDNGGLPLLVSRGTTAQLTNGAIIFDTASNAWKGKGAAIYFLNGSADFKRPLNGSTKTTNSLIGSVPTNFPPAQWP